MRLQIFIGALAAITLPAVMGGALFAQGDKAIKPPTDEATPAEMRKYADACLYGQGVERNYELALAWYRKAADAGDARAMADVGGIYSIGRGVAKDPVQAAS